MTEISKQKNSYDFATENVWINQEFAFLTVISRNILSEILENKMAGKFFIH